MSKNANARRLKANLDRAKQAAAKAKLKTAAKKSSRTTTILRSDMNGLSSSISGTSSDYSDSGETA